MTDTGALRTLFARSRLFAGIEERDFQLFVQALRHRTVAKGQVVFSAGDPGDYLAVVTEGQLRIAVPRGTGQQEDVGQIGPGDVIGEMACVDPAPRSATVTAVTNAEVLELDRGTFTSIRARAPAIFASIMGGIIARTSDRLRDTTNRIEVAFAALGVAPTVPHMSAFDGSCTPPAAVAVERDLRRYASLKGFSAAELETLQKVAPIHHYDDQAVVYQEGEPSESCIVLLAGTVEIVKTINGKDRCLSMLAEGSFCGQNALVNDCARQATVRAAGPVEVLEFSRHNFESLLAARAPLAIRFQEQVAVAGIRQLRMANSRMATVLDRVDALQREYEEAREHVEAHAAEDLARAAAFAAEAGARTGDPMGREGIAQAASAVEAEEEFIDELPPEQTVAADFLAEEDDDAPSPSAPPSAGVSLGSPLDAKAEASGRAGAAASRGAPRSGQAGIPTEVLVLDVERDDVASEMAFVQAALDEWGLDMKEIASVKTKVPDGMMTGAELRGRTRK